jgi:hypothetical protein
MWKINNLNSTNCEQIAKSASVNKKKAGRTLSCTVRKIKIYAKRSVISSGYSFHGIPIQRKYRRLSSFLPSAHQKIKTCVSAACVFSTLSVSNVALIGKWHVKVNYWKNNIKYTRYCCSKIKRLLRVSCEMMKGNFLRAPCNNSNIFISFKPCLQLHCMDLG